MRDSAATPWIEMTLCDAAPMAQWRGSFSRTRAMYLPRNFVVARLVYLADTSRQKKLMIIFIDDLAP